MMDPWKSTLWLSNAESCFKTQMLQNPSDTDLSLQFVLWVILYPVACSFWEPYACIRDELPLLFCEKPLGETLGEIPVNCAEAHNENLGMKDVWTLPAIFPFYLIPEIFQSAWEKLK